MGMLTLILCLLGDIIYLNDGRQIEGRIIEEGAGYIRVQTALGETEIDRFDIKKIEKKDWTPPPKKDKPKPEPPKPKPKPKEDPKPEPAQQKPAPKEEPWQKVKLETQYRDPFINFRINFPKEWVASKQTAEKAAVTFEGPKDGIFVPKMHMYIERPGKDFVDYVNEHQDQLKNSKDYTDMTIKPFEATLLGGRNAIIFVARYKEGIVSMASLWFFLDAGERKFVLMFPATEVLEGRYEAQIQATVRSLRVFDEHKVDMETRKKFTRLYNLGAQLTNDKKYDEALKACEEALAITPKYPDLLNVIGRIHARMKDYAKACDSFQKASDLDPDNFEYAFNVSAMFQSLKKFPEALKYAERACDIDPRSEPAWTNKGTVLIYKRDFPKAKEALLKAIELNPESASAHFYMGFALEATDKLKEAEREYNEVLKIDPKHENAQAALKRVKEAQKDK